MSLHPQLAPYEQGMLELSRAWPDGDLVVIDEAGHYGPGMPEAIVGATDRFARRSSAGTGR